MGKIDVFTANEEAIKIIEEKFGVTAKITERDYHWYQLNENEADFLWYCLDGILGVYNYDERLGVAQIDGCYPFHANAVEFLGSFGVFN